MFILGFVIFLLCSISTVILLGGRIDDFANSPSFFLIITALVAFLAATKSFKVFYGGLKAVILPKSPLSENLRGQAATLFRLLSKTTAVVTGIGVLIALINTIMNLNFDDPDRLSHIGFNISFGLIVMAHGLFLIAAIFEPVVFNLKKRRDMQRTPE